jgi:hypothetical protein
LISRIARPVVLGCALLAGSGCNDPADFARAKGAADFPSTSVAYRIFSVSSDCTSIGTVEHAATIQAVAVTVANHGGTHYLITDERYIQEVVTSGQSLGGAAYAQQTSTTSRTKQLSAEAYRCPPRTRAPQVPTTAPESPPPPPLDAPAPAVDPIADAGAD